LDRRQDDGRNEREDNDPDDPALDDACQEGRAPTEDDTGNGFPLAGLCPAVGVAIAVRLFASSRENPFVVLTPEELATHLDERILSASTMTTFFGRAGVLSATPLTSCYESSEEGSLITIGRATDIGVEVVSQHVAGRKPKSGHWISRSRLRSVPRLIDD
jgi:hypothetical protein